MYWKSKLWKIIIIVIIHIIIIKILYHYKCSNKRYFAPLREKEVAVQMLDFRSEFVISEISLMVLIDLLLYKMTRYKDDLYKMTLHADCGTIHLCSKMQHSGKEAAEAYTELTGPSLKKRKLGLQPISQFFTSTWHKGILRSITCNRRWCRQDTDTWEHSSCLCWQYTVEQASFVTVEFRVFWIQRTDTSDRIREWVWTGSQWESDRQADCHSLWDGREHIDFVEGNA